MNTVLLCTVGGAHRPILRAIESVAPEYVCFFCTERDARTGQTGSDVQVVGEGKVIKAEPQAEKPTLPNIPTQAQLRKSRFECRVVPADSLDGAVAAMRTAVAELLGKWPGSRLIADYTGGTKTMTAALVLTAFEFNEVELQLVAGARPNLLRTADETEQTRVASVGALRLRKTLVDCLDAWTRFSYDEAAEGLAAIRAPIDTPGAETLPFATAMSKALAHWDRFDHASALRLIEPFGSRVMALYPKLLPNVKLLTKDGRGREPARLFDLWQNMQRRAAQGRYDDAVARWYRLVEWTAQWQIREHLGVETNDFPAEKLPPFVEVAADEAGKIKVPLLKSWEIVAATLGSPCDGFFDRHGGALKDLLQIRNNSILAHGFDPITEADWQRIQRWTQECFLPLLRELAWHAGRGVEIDQLPDRPPPLQ